jgi:phosphoglycolate phosphatase
MHYTITYMSVLIFDFDGTIANSREYVLQFMTRDSKHQALTKSQLNELNGLTLLSIARRLGYSWWRLPGLYLRGRKSMEKIINSLKPFPGMPEVIKKLHAEGHELFIVSNNSVKNIQQFLLNNNLREHFVEIYGGIELLGKAPVFHSLLNEHSLDKAQTICIGDQAGDINAGRSAGLKTVAVTWGFGRAEELASIKPNALANQPEQLIDNIEEI